MTRKQTGFFMGAAAAALAAFPVSVWAQEGGGLYTHGMGWGGGGWWGMFFGPVMMIAVLAVIVAIVVFILRGTGSAPSGPPAGKTPLHILKERFAKGEIDKDEFEERRRILDE